MRAQKKREEEELQTLTRRVHDDAPPPGSVTCPARNFVDLPISRATLQGLKNGGFTRMTEVQRTAIPHALAERDLQGGARTGSGKTLAFLVPVLERLYRARWSKMDGLGALVISPTRELALQIFDVLRVVGREHVVSAGLIIGGKDVRSEQERIGGMNILVSTPGRLLQHLDETHGFDCSSLMVLVLDEADRILDLGFAKTLNAIIQHLPKQRQTLLFSATLTKSVKALARLSLNRDAEVVGVRDKARAVEHGAGDDAGEDEDGEASEADKAVTGFEMPRKLLHCYMECELHEKLNVLYTFVKTHIKQKTIVFLSSCKQTKFFYEAIRRARPGVSVMCMHGRMKQMKRMAAYCRFCDSSASVLLATDIAARGLDFTAVDWVVQLDCPEDVPSYIHRSGRTARYKSAGRSLLILLPSEREAMLRNLAREARIVPKSVSMNTQNGFNLQTSLAGWVAADPELKYLAQKAFVTFVRSYYLQRDKEVFDVGALPLTEYASALGLPGAPRIRFVKSSAKAADNNTSAGGQDSSDEESAAGSSNQQTRKARDKVSKLMTRQNVGVLDSTRAALRADDESSDDEDLMHIKRHNHDLPDDSAVSAADAESAKKAELKKMSRKQRREAKRLERGEHTKKCTIQPLQPSDSTIIGWKEEAAEYAASVRGQLTDQDAIDKERNQQRVRAKHRAQRQARREAERQQGDSGSSDSDGELPDIGDTYGGASDSSDDEVDEDSGIDARGRHKRLATDDGNVPRENKRVRRKDSSSTSKSTPVGDDLATLAAQILQSRSLLQ